MRVSHHGPSLSLVLIKKKIHVATETVFSKAAPGELSPGHREGYFVPVSFMLRQAQASSVDGGRLRQSQD